MGCSWPSVLLGRESSLPARVQMVARYPRIHWNSVAASSAAPRGGSPRCFFADSPVLYRGRVRNHAMAGVPGPQGRTGCRAAAADHAGGSVGLSSSLVWVCLDITWSPCLLRPCSALCACARRRAEIGHCGMMAETSRADRSRVVCGRLCRPAGHEGRRRGQPDRGETPGEQAVQRGCADVVVLLSVWCCFLNLTLNHCSGHCGRAFFGLRTASVPGL